MYGYRLCSEITDETLKDFSKFVEGIEDGAEVSLYISSYGGDCFMSVGIIDIMQRKHLNTTAIILGVAASAAAIIALSCNKVIMSPLGHLMLHSAWSENPNDDEGVKAANDAQFAVIHKRCPSLSAKDIFNGCDKWIGAKEALTLGLIDDIDSSYAVAAMTNNIYNNYNGDLKMEEKEKEMQETVEQVEEQITSGENADVSLLDLIEKLAERVAMLEDKLYNNSSLSEAEEDTEDEEQKRMEALYARITAPSTVSAKVVNTNHKRNVYKVGASFKDYIRG